MNLELILLKESVNEGYIYLYYAEDGREGWLAYDRSAFYLNLLRPSLPVAREYVLVPSVPVAGIFVAEASLLDLTDSFPALIDDSCIQLEVPPGFRSRRSEYEEWAGGLG